MFLGYPQGNKGYRLWIREENGFKIINSKDMIFNDIVFPCQSWTNPSSSDVSVTNMAETLENIIQVEPIVQLTTPQAQGQSNSSDRARADQSKLFH